MRIAVVSLFPVMIREALVHGVVRRALDSGALEVHCVDPRDFATDLHRTVDDRPYGGGPGWCSRSNRCAAPCGRRRRGSGRAAGASTSARRGGGSSRARARPSRGRDWSLAGRYEGVDERLLYDDEEGDRV